MGFTVGAQIADVDDEQRCGSGTAYHVGAMYGQGPWAISVTAIDGEVEQTDGGLETPRTVRVVSGLRLHPRPGPEAGGIVPGRRGWTGKPMPTTPARRSWSVSQRRLLIATSDKDREGRGINPALFCVPSMIDSLEVEVLYPA